MNTQSNEIKPIDARTFPQIWVSLTPFEQTSLNSLLQDKLGVSRMSVYNWATGKTRPIMYVRKGIAQVVKNALGINVSFQTLF